MSERLRMSSQSGKQRKLIVQLKGGLGNQMFQYACARALALQNEVDLVVDDWSGFVRDVQYRRNYELDALPIQARITKPWERLPIWINRLDHRITNKELDLVEKRWYGRFINETAFKWLPELHEVPLEESTWITGYWQSPLYFDDYADWIRRELNPKPSRKSKFVEMAKQINSSDSVAVGVRLYEESKNPNAHASSGHLKSAEQIREAVFRICRLRPKAKFFVFCTHRSSLLYDIGLPSNSIFVTHDDGYMGTLDRLWLIAQCRHHLFTNSTFYWWGAWLSMYFWKEENQIIMAADNFINSDSLCVDWLTF